MNNGPLGKCKQCGREYHHNPVKPHKCKEQPASTSLLPAHGSPEDRGFSDAWYHRYPRPHKGSTSAPDYNLTSDEIAAYYRGYEDARELGGKDWT